MDYATPHTAVAALNAAPPPRTAVAVAAHAAELSPDVVRAFRVLPAGRFRAVDGRPEEVPHWELTDEDGARIVATLAARASAVVIDYEHATIHAQMSGAKAPAAGWARRFEWRSGDGLWAVDVEWTAAAAQAIAAREYRYISPVFSYGTRTGRVERLLHLALTNNPGLDGLTDLAALAAGWLARMTTPINPPQEDVSMDHLKALLAALGLQESATQAESLAAVTALKNNVAALTAQVAAPDPAKFVPVATLSALQGEHTALQDKYAALQAEIDGAHLDQTIAAGKAAGKITPALESWARDLGKKDLAALTAWLDKAPAVAKPGESQSGSANDAGGTAALSADQAKVCELMGISQDDYRKTLAAA